MPPRRPLLGLGLGLALLARPAAPAGAQPAPDGRPRDVVIMIADGWGFPHQAAASLFATGEAGGLAWHGFPVRLAMTTLSTGGRPEDPADAGRPGEGPVTDSAAAATAISTGVKTRNGALGLDAEGHAEEHLLAVAERAGRATGVVTTVPLSHATPAGFSVHNPSRRAYEAIAREMLLGTGLDVVMGGGHPWHDADGARLERPRTFKFVGGESLWDSLRAGLAGNDADGDGRPDPWRLIETREAFLALTGGPAPARLLGVAPVAETLQQERRGDGHAVPGAVPPVATVPDLPTMVLGALNVLDDDPDGFALLVEGGAVDWAAHDNQSGRMIEELLGFHAAAESVLAWLGRTGRAGTALVIVTGDHETGGLALEPAPGAAPAAGVVPPLRWMTGGHTARPVPFFATGPGSERFAGLARPVAEAPLPAIDNTDIGRVVKELLEPRRP